MKSLIILICNVFFITNLVYSQQWVNFSQKNHYKLFLSPANSGENSKFHASLAHRSQYTFLSKRNIASQFGEISMPIFSKNYGIGLRIINDFIGYQRYTLAELSGAYHLSFKKSTISIGIGIGLVNLSLNGSKLRTSNGDYNNEQLIHNDKVLHENNISGNAPSFSLGIAYKIGDFSIGVATHNLNSPKISLIKNKNETKIIISRTINLYSSYVIKMTKVNIIPLINYSTDFIKHQIQIGINTELNNIYFGLAFRGYSKFDNDALIGEIGVKIKDKIRVGYSYDYNLSFLNKSNFGSHEISVSYFMFQNFSKKNKGNVLFNPRFL